MRYFQFESRYFNSNRDADDVGAKFVHTFHWSKRIKRYLPIICTRQMAQVSHSTSQLQTATAFHFFIVNSFSGCLATDASPFAGMVASVIAMHGITFLLFIQIIILTFTVTEMCVLAKSTQNSSKYMPDTFYCNTC